MTNLRTAFSTIVRSSTLNLNADVLDGLVDTVRHVGDSSSVPPGKSYKTLRAQAAAKRKMRAAGVPCVPGYEGRDMDAAVLAAEAARIGYPVMIKAAAGGGGRGMRLADCAAGFAAALAAARSEALAAFGSDEVILEKALQHSRHVEVQVFGDAHGHVIHLGERDCSIQRRHQKVVEEAPSPAVDGDLRARMGAAAAGAAQAIGYQGAGTVEFLLDGNGDFYFLEMNTRLQVEHPVTEAIFGVDLVREQIRVAEGLPMSFTQDDLTINGHAIEVRLNAEKLPDFAPRPGKITAFHAPGGLGVRMDSALYDGYVIPPYYDSLIGKLIVHGRDRAEALARLDRALGELIIDGVENTVPLFAALLQEPEIQSGDYNIHWLEHWLKLGKLG